ncbi:undecaprenyl-phosphate glucose phosphotransferase [Mucilaginibacter sp. PAMB04274]|uniref:undecaprenyl-phosphate glucose phosphotransferase n=1 Tax=Mucilaginibacter sp. PAMB04274 TaxID=3138568 RepID=UPI0031F6FEA1
METRSFYILRYALAFSDMLLVNLCFYAASNLSNTYDSTFTLDYRYDLIISNLLWILCTSIYGLYFDKTIHKLESVYKTTSQSIILHLVLFLTFLFFCEQTHFPRRFLIYFYAVMVMGFLLSRFIGTLIMSLYSKNLHMGKAVAVLGMNECGLKLASYLIKQNSLNFVGILDKDRANAHSNEDVDLSDAVQYIRNAALNGVEEVYISVKPDKIDNLSYLLKVGEQNCIRLKFVPDLSGLESKFKFNRMGDFAVLCARREPLEDITNRFKKRVFDIAVSLGVIVFIFSWLYPLLAVLIKLQSRGPVFFAQLRTGRNNRPFWCYKFRSMRMNTDSDKRQASVNDDRITPIGRFIRKTSLDEFPQFFNVLLGYMSIVGPRPHMLSHTEQYSKIIDKYMVRQFLKPGITGWAQINGYRGETRESYLMEKRVEHDIWYMEHWSVMLDLKIVFLTIINMIRGEKNAY